VAANHIERVLKDELQRLEKKLRVTEMLRAAGWVGSLVGASLVLSAMADQLLFVAAIAGGAALLNLAATRLLSRKSERFPTNKTVYK
jgi:hypothetical protein